MRDDGYIVYSIDPDWRNASMAFAHILRDGDDSVVTVAQEDSCNHANDVQNVKGNI